MLVIRLARGGRNKYPTYRIVAAESSRAATGKFVEVLGHYNPHTKELVIKKEETLKRLSHGAQPSPSVAKLLKKENIDLPAWVKLHQKNRKPKNEPVEKPAAPEAAAEEAPAAEPEAAPVETPVQEERVAEVATEAAAEAEEKATPAAKTETTEDTEKAAEAVEATEEAAADQAKS